MYLAIYIDRVLQLHFHLLSAILDVFVFDEGEHLLMCSVHEVVTVLYARRFHGLDNPRGRRLKRKGKGVWARGKREGCARKLSGSSCHLFGFRFQLCWP